MAQIVGHEATLASSPGGSRTALSSIVLVGLLLGGILAVLFIPGWGQGVADVVESSQYLIRVDFIALLPIP